MDGKLHCECCADDCGEINVSEYALSFSESNSGANIIFVCSDCFKPQIDFMFGIGAGSVDVQSMGESGKDA